MHRILVPGRIDEQNMVWITLGKLVVAAADAAMELGAFLLHAVEQGIQSFRSSGLIDVEDDIEIGQTVPGGHGSDLHDLLQGKSARRALISAGGGDKAIREHQITAGKCWCHKLFNQLRATRHIQHHLAPHGHVGIGWVEQHLPNLLADRCAAGFANLDHTKTSSPGEGCKPGHLSRLAGPVGALERDKFPSQQLVHDWKCRLWSRPGQSAGGDTIAPMRVILRNLDREQLGTIELVPAETPSKVETDLGRVVFLDWERSQDDEGHLRRCLSCGGDTLYRHRRFPQITGFIAVLALALGLGGILGLATGWPVFIAMLIVLTLDIAILFLSPETLECYRCRSSFRNLDIARYHERWDRGVAARFSDSSSA